MNDFKNIFVTSNTMNKNIKKAAVAMSGGVDSSVAAALMLEQGYEVIGLTIKTWDYENIAEKDTGCCSLDSIYRAKNVAHQLGIPHYTFDMTKEFNDSVIENFVSEYMSGRTPNPCVLCNKKIKWGTLLEKAEALGADVLVTGHYAKINYDEKSGRYFLSVPEDKHKDQTYFLWSLSQYALSKTLFPLGDYIKSDIRKLAEKFNLKSAHTPDSQEICFVPDNDYSKLIEMRKPEVKESLAGGNIIYGDKVVGHHKGYPYYTIGQRKGLNLAVGKALYVSKIIPEKNEIIMGDSDTVLSSEFIAKDINLMYPEKIDGDMHATIKIRYKDAGTPGIIRQTDDNIIEVKLDVPKRAITPGQSAVFYIDDNLIGGGVIF